MVLGVKRHVPHQKTAALVSVVRVLVSLLPSNVHPVCSANTYARRNGWQRSWGSIQ
jgi:hypothetical protein